MITIPVELDLVSAAIVDVAAPKNANAFLVSFLADEVKQTCDRGNPEFAQKVKHTRTAEPRNRTAKRRLRKHEGRTTKDGKAVAE